MKSKLLFVFLVVIVLVSLNWFKEVFAADLNQLSENQKQLLEKYKQERATSNTDEYEYTTPDLFNNPQNDSQTEPGNVTANSSMTGGGLTSAPKENLISFDQLKPFGEELFQNQTNSQPIAVGAGSDYILGPSDNIILYLWGRVEKEYKLTVDREGKVVIPKVGELVCVGLTLDEFKKKAEKKFTSVYSEFELTASLGKIRNIQIYITGEVNRPGAFNVSSLTSMFDALYLAGGPNHRGSMRSIRLMRRGKAVAEVDLYRLLLEGDNSSDIRLESGDVIFVPVAGPRVAIRGEINRSAIYEIKGEQSTSDLLRLAGQATPQAYLERVMLERIDENDQWKVLDLNLKNENKDDINLKGGDRVTVYSIFEAKQNIVAVFGKVKHAGYYERKEATCVSDIINQAQLQPYDVYTERADLFRRHTDNKLEIIPIDLKALLNGSADADLEIMDRDSLHIYSIDEIEHTRYVYIEGEVKNPGRYPLYENMTVEDLIFLAGSFTKGAQRHRGEIARVDQSAEVNLLDIDLTDNNNKKMTLAEDDHLYIRQIPDYELDRSVELAGEVRYPGRYTISNDHETLWQLIQRAGGFSYEAFPRGLVFERASIQQNLERIKINEIIEKSIPMTFDTNGRIVQNELIDYNTGSMKRIIIDMDQIISSNGTKGDVKLEPNDRIFVPAVPSGISVMGAVSANGTIKYEDKKSVKYYLERAGGYARHADKDQTRLIRANGEVHSGGGVRKQRVELGDLIVVPTKVEKNKNFMKSFSETLGVITGALTTVFIISKI